MVHSLNIILGIFTETLLSSRHIAKGNLDPVSSSSILPSGLTDVTDFLKNNLIFFNILDNHLPINESSEKYCLEMKNREEMRQNEPGSSAS